VKILICVAFHFNQSQLLYLQQVLKSYVEFAVDFELFIMTNTVDNDEVALLRSALPVSLSGQIMHIISFVNLINPWLLTWGHKQVMRDRFANHDFTHFIYAEGDIELTRSNLKYWLAERDILRPYNLYPGFVRVEWSDLCSAWVSVDVTSKINESKVPMLIINETESFFVNLNNAYQGCFLYDRELMEEHMNSTTFDVNAYGNIEKNNLEWGGGMAENANFALTFVNVPLGFTSRNVVRYYGKYKMLDPRSFIHHLPNKYANVAHSPHSKIQIMDLFI
jgi:hypothetical protein